MRGLLLMPDRTDYLASSESQSAIQELTEVCFELSAQGKDEEDFPDAIEFLATRGVRPPGEGTIRVRHTVEEEGVQPADLMTPSKPRCPDGHDGCLPTDCRMIKGRWVCSWVCDCPY
jgi:hypothetical protein